MKRKRYSEEQIIRALREVDSGAVAREVSRRLGVTEQTFYRWRAKYAGMNVDEAKRLRALEDENRRLKKLVAELMLDNQILKDVNSRKW